MREDLAAISKFGFGCMRLPLLDPLDQTSIDLAQFTEMVDLFMDAGGSYFDTAYVYHEGASETALREALVKRHPRDSYTIATKCLAWALPDKETAQACLPTSLERLGVDYIDFYLLHNVGGERTAKFDEYDMWNFVKEQKEAGRIRNIGFSIHDGADCLDELLTAHPEMDFVQLQVNYLDWDDPVIQSRRLMEVAEAHGVPVVIMEPLRGGRLAELPPRAAKVFNEAAPDRSHASWGYRFCWNLPNVITVLAGASTIEQMRDNISNFAANEPFSPDEQATFDRAIEALNAVPTIPCTNCGYCLKDCPEGVVIPNILGILNLEAITGNREFAKSQYSWQAAPGPASACIQCGTCEMACTQSIGIIKELERAVKHFES